MMMELEFPVNIELSSIDKEQKYINVKKDLLCLFLLSVENLQGCVQG